MQSVPQAETPLPLKQMFALAVVLLNESLCSTMLLPYVGLLVSHIQNKPPEEAGYVSGLLVGVFMFGQVVSSTWWGCFSDKYGRRPPLLIGLFSSGCIMLGFGFSGTVWLCILFRFVHGLFNGNVLVAKTVLADILDRTNEAKGFTLVSLTYGIGTLIGPSVGGLLYDPANNTAMHWAGFSKDGLFAKFPGLLPALVVVVYTIFGMFVCIVYVTESNPKAQPLPRWVRFLIPCLSHTRSEMIPLSNSPAEEVNEIGKTRCININKSKGETVKTTETVVVSEEMLSHDLNERVMYEVSLSNRENRNDMPFEEEMEELQVGMTDEDEEENEEHKRANRNGWEQLNEGQSQGEAETFGYKEAFTFPTTRDVLIIYMLLSVADMGFGEIFPLWAIAGPLVGGLGLKSDEVGLFLLSHSVPCVLANLCFHLACRAITDKMQLWRVSLVGMAIAVGFIPFASYFPHGISQFTVVLLCMFSRQWFAAWAYSLITLLTARSAPKGCVGTMYGINQSCGAVMRCVGPIIVTPLFAWSISGNHMPPFNHMFVFILTFIIFLLAALLSYKIVIVEDIGTQTVVQEVEEVVHGVEEVPQGFVGELNSRHSHDQ
ncbi:putative transporter [Trypanosoma theileri]|uniref:Putative transporter n=1 Tax=Trypanosoma theileri TaxID=67003 RepID=A0A1X0P6I4_9TRYP|nr:putative transporter [Trypanosoma theileri]ORC92189.1 putative transporter [Trypanosoma theileri]